MTIRFLGDADFNERIVRGVLRREPRIDFLVHQDAIPARMKDPLVLELAASMGRILVTHDVRTMPRHLAEFIVHSNSPGVFVIPRTVSIGDAIEEILTFWYCSVADEWINRLEWLR